LNFPPAGAVAQDIHEIQAEFHQADEDHGPSAGQNGEIAFVPDFGSNCFLVRSKGPSGTRDL
jgi:hypothetical protein